MIAPRTFLAAMALTIFSVSCILVVSPDEHGAQCRFRGEDTGCGRCLSQRCQAAIDATCLEESIISVVEQCAASGDDACNRVPASDLATCMTTRCNALCYTRVGTSQTKCTESFVAPGLACSCELAGSVATDLACNSEVYPRTRCCAPRAWPAAALECACNAVACFPSSLGGCTCILGDNLDETTAIECKAAKGGHCCAIEERCQCRDRACATNEREVDVCNKQELACPKGTVEVESCAIRQ